MRTLTCTQIADLQEALGTEGEMMTHFEECYSSFGRLVVCSNEYHESDWAGGGSQGRLAEWDGARWTVLEEKPFTCVSGRHDFGGTIFATGWNQASAIMKVFAAANEEWTTYRLPKASHCFDHKWQTSGRASVRPSTSASSWTTTASSTSSRRGRVRQPRLGSPPCQHSPPGPRRLLQRPRDARDGRGQRLAE